jgi:chromosome segregation protein
MLNESLVSSKKAEIEEIDTAVSELNKNLEEYTTLLNNKTRLIEKFKHSKIKLDEELSSSRNLLNKADNLARTYEIKQNIVRSLNNEDVTIAELIKDTVRHGIKELVHSAIKYDTKYERAIFAAASEWLKTIIVNDTKSMISIALYVKLRKLPRVKMIPLDILGYIKAPKPVNDDVNVIGNLADLVYSDYKNLSGFLFGNTLLVKRPTSAYILAQQGYRTVSIDGVLFEPSGRGLSLDFRSQISDLTREILLVDSVRGLRILLSDFKILTEKKSLELADNTAKISDSETEKIKAEAKIAGIHLQFSTLEVSRRQTEKMLDKLVLDSTAIQSVKDSWVYELKRYQKQMLLLTNIVHRIYRNILDLDQVLTASEDIRVNMTRKNGVLRSIEELDFEIRELTMSSLSLNNQIEVGMQNLKGIDEQKQLLKSELQEMSKQGTSFSTKLESLESELQLLRDKEQQAIDSSGSSYSMLQEYEQKIKNQRDIEKKISKEYNAIEKEIAMLRRDILDNSSEQSRLYNDLNSLGYKERDQLEAFDVDLTIKDLTAELESTKTRINLRAHETYVQVIDGYRGISTRQNQLESERNSIVLFIEGVIKEKNAVFMEAFRKVDEDIRKSFSEVAGGQAWLEIENVEDIFSSGIMLMVQFPGKPGRESTALSGGEKTIAAAIFLLALQSLKPSPFYLMDEIDAHLDAENNDRLSRVLLSRSKDNQIIVVTLKDTTVAKADIIYGVYAKEGMSQIVKYKHSSNQAIAQIRSNDNT